MLTGSGEIRKMGVGGLTNSRKYEKESDVPSPSTKGTIVVQYITRFILIYNISPHISIIPSEASREEHLHEYPLHALTQGPRGTRSEWIEFVQKLGIHFDAYTSGEVAPAVSDFFSNAPCVIARLKGGAHRLFMTTEQLRACHGSITLFLEKMERLLEARDLDIAEDASSSIHSLPKRTA